METLTKCSKGNIAGVVRYFSKGKQSVKSLWIALLDTPSNRNFPTTFLSSAA